jgi:hypothetical protein
LAAANRTVSQPTVSFSTLARLLGPSTPVKQSSLLRGHKYPSDGPKRSYQNAQKQLVDYLVNGSPINTAAMNLRGHERDALAQLNPAGVLPNGVTASRPNAHAPAWQLHNVTISMYPDVELAGPSGVGALKAYFGKDPLARGVGASMAALLHFYKSHQLALPNVSPTYCMVLEVRTGALYTSSNPSTLMKNVATACQLISALWPTL